MAVGVLLSPSAVCAESGAASLRQQAASAPGGASAGEFGHRSSVPEGGPVVTNNIVSQRPTASGDVDGEMAVSDGAGGRRLMWWNWLVAGGKLRCFDRFAPALA